MVGDIIGVLCLIVYFVMAAASMVWIFILLLAEMAEKWRPRHDEDDRAFSILVWIAD